MSRSGPGGGGPGPLLPRPRRSPLAWLAWAAGLSGLVLVTALGSSAAREALAARAWSPSRLIIGVEASVLDPADAAASRAAETLMTLPEVARAEPLPPDPSEVEIGSKHGGRGPAVAASRWISVDPRAHAAVSVGRLRDALRRDGVRLADPPSTRPPLAARWRWAAAAGIAALGLAMLMVGMAGRVAAQVIEAASPAIERLRGFGAGEGRLAWALLPGAVFVPLASAATALLLTAGGEAALRRLGPEHRAGVGLTGGDLDIALLLLPAPALIALVLCLTALRRSARAWP